MTTNKNTNTETKTTTATAKAKPAKTPKATAQKAVATLKKTKVAPMNPPAVKEVYSAEMLKELDKHTKAVKSGLSGIDKGFEKVTFNLYWIYETGTYKAMGCDNIGEFAQKQFDIGKTSAYGFIQLAERFGGRDESGHLTGSFDDKYKGYSSSKLSLIADLSDEEIAILGITSDMSFRDIKKVVKNYLKGLESPEKSTKEISGSGTKETVTDSGTEETAEKPVTHVIYTFKDFLDVETTLSKDDFCKSLKSLLSDNSNAVLKLVLVC